jgi:hypothetical protein
MHCHQLCLPFHACTGRASGERACLGTASCSKTPPKLILSRPAADGSCYSTSAAKDWTVVDLGSCHNEGELLIAADDRLAELLQWAGAGTRNDFVAAAVKTSRFSRRLQLDPGLMPPTSWSLTPCIDPLQLPRRLGEKSRRWRDLSHAPRKCRKSLRRRWFLEPSERQRAPGHR